MTKSKVDDKLRQEIVASEKVQEFLDNFLNKNTRAGYQSALVHFFRFLDIKPENWIREVRFLENKERILALEIYEKDLTRYWKHMLKQKTPPMTVNGYIKVVRVFLIENNIYLPNKLWKNFNRRGNGNEARTKDRKPSKNELFRICDHADIRIKALALVLSSSGMRVGEALQLEPDDIDFDSVPTMIKIEYNEENNVKTKKSR